MASGIYDFDSFEADSEIARPKRALFTIDLEDKANEKEIHRWLTGELNWLQEKSHDRITNIRRNLALYRGKQYYSQDVRDHHRDNYPQHRKRSTPRVVVNNLYDLTQRKVSRLVKFKPGVSVLPTNDEFEDRVAASSTEKLLKHIWHIERFQEDLTRKIAKISKVTGEAYLFVLWDPEKGDVHPDSKELENGTQKVPLVDDMGDQLRDDLGNPVFIESPVMTGDVKYEIERPWNVYIERKHN